MPSPDVSRSGNSLWAAAAPAAAETAVSAKEGAPGQRRDQARQITVYADRRWPAHFSVGAVRTRYEARLPAQFALVDLQVRGRIGSPLSPLAISRALVPAVRARGRLWPAVFFSPGLMVPLYSPVPSVVVMHDLSHRHTYTRSHRVYVDTVLRPLYRRCAAVVCVSEATRTEFLDWSGLDPARVHCVPNGPPEGLSAEGPRHDPGYPYLFYFGHHRAHKNLGRMVEAFCRSRLPAAGLRFVLTNGPNPELVAIAERHGFADRLVFVGFLNEEDLHAHIRGASAIAYVSRYEGFGLPILEGFAAGVPVLTSTTTSMPEVAGGGALLVDPESIDAITEGMERIVEDNTLRAELIARGSRRLQDFDWDRSAERLWRIVGNVAA